MSSKLPRAGSLGKIISPGRPSATRPGDSALISLPRPLSLALPRRPWGNSASILGAACAVRSHTWISGERSPDVHQSSWWKCSHRGPFQAFRRDFSEGVLGRIVRGWLS